MADNLPHCTHCGARQLMASPRFCHRCGQPIVEQVPKRRRRIPWLVLCLLVILALVAVAEVVLLLTGWPKMRTEATPDVQATAQAMLHLWAAQTAQAQPVETSVLSATPTMEAGALPPWTATRTPRPGHPQILQLSTAGGTARKEVSVGDVSVITMTFAFDFQRDTFAADMIVWFYAKYAQKKPHVSMSWTKPDGEVIRLVDLGVEKGQVYPFGQDAKLTAKLGGVSPVTGLFAVDPVAQAPVVQKGHYSLQIIGFVFESGSDLDAEFILYGGSP